MKAVFFVRLVGEDAELARTRVHLLWLEPDKDSRTIAGFNMNVFGGQRTRYTVEVPSETQMIEGTNWLKLTPKDPLVPGEFAIATLPKDANQQPSAAYDFRIQGDISKTIPYPPQKESGAAPAKNH